MSSRLIAPAVIAAAMSTTRPVASPGACPADMVEIEGDFCPWVEQPCLRYVDPKHPENDRCAEFAASERCESATTRKRFCVDRFEWPNQAGAVPVVAVDWFEARQRCAGLGKRLCTESEWTLACEGPERLPYPYGYTRNSDACNIDRPYILPDEAKWQDPATRPAELARLDQREPSGTRDSCVSPYGVFDMTGNVDEWVVNETGRTDDKPYVSGLKGGYWGPVRDRCRPMTTDHDQTFIFYQIGFRCCADVQRP